MGAGVETEDGHLPLSIEGRPLRSITYELPVASAQVKSAILLAGLYAIGETTVVEPAPTRDHTELMLEAAGATITRRENSVTVRRRERLELGEIEVPGDFSSAAPFIVAATLVPGSELHIHGVNLNPRRTGLLTILERMGGARHRLQPSPHRGRAGGRPRGALGRARRDDRPRARGAARDRRAPPVRPGGLVRARLQPPARGGGAAREGVRPRRGDGRRPARARPARARDRGRVPDPWRPDPSARRQDREPRRPPDRDARRRCRARFAARGRDRGRRVRRSKLPGLLRAPRLDSAGRPPHDHRDRRSRRGRQELGRTRARGAARVSATSTRGPCTGR